VNIEVEDRIIDIEDEMKQDLEVEESNLLGEKKKQKDLIRKWTVRLAKIENEIKKCIILTDIKVRDLHVFYTTEFDRKLAPGDIKIYINADKDIVELRNRRRKLETMSDVIKGAISSVRERGKTIDTMISMMSNM